MRGAHAPAHLATLLRLDADTLAAYRIAAHACTHPLVRSALEAFRDDHARHIALLAPALGAAPGARRVRGWIMRSLTRLMSRGTHSALTAMRGNETVCNRVYAEVLEDAALPDQLRALVIRCQADERRHLAWLEEALENRIWEEAPAGAPRG